MVLTLASALPLAAASGAEPRLEDFFERWREAAGPWMTESEGQLFDRLESEHQRELFLHHFWAQRDPHPETVDNPVAERFQSHLEEALARFERLDDARARAMLLAGKPLQVTHLGACADVLRPLEIWSYREERFVLFYRRGTQVVHWSPSDGVGALKFGDSSRWTSQQLFEFFEDRGCWRSRQGDQVDLQTALDEGLAFDELAEQSVSLPRDTTWTEEFTGGEASGELQLPITGVSLITPGRYQQKTILQGQFQIPAAWVGRNAEGHLFDRLVMRGDVWWGDQVGGRLVDSFQIAHYVAGAPSDESTFPLAFYRRLRPGTYSLDVRLEDRRGLALARHRQTLVIPRLTEEAMVPAGYAKGFAGLTRSVVGVLTTFPGIEVLSPGEHLMIGEIWVEAVTTGGPIERVEFHLDGQIVATDEQSPYAALVDFGSEPAPHVLTAVAFDPGGQELVRDERSFEVSSRRFAVHLAEPAQGTYGRQARVIVELPPEAALEKVELFLGDQPFATLRTAPFVHALPSQRPAPGRDPSYVRAVATLESGEEAEDLVLIDSRAPFEEIDVQLVELYTTVLDVRGRPVSGLGQDAFTIYDDDVAQTLQRFDTVENLAINVALLMDTSSSMRRQLELASGSARRFFETVLTPKDQASLLVFNDDIRQVVPFTHDVDQLLREVAGFRAWGTTRLYDSLIYSVRSFGGLEGKRALVLLSDGQDVDSDFPFRQVLEAALKSHIAVYPIVLGLEDPQTLADLETLATETGGRFFAIGNIDQLDRVYRRIEEELRSQYLLVYEPPPRAARGELRRVRVEVAGEGLRARTLTGYYP